MSDLYELQLAWELDDTLPGEVLDELRWHLGLRPPAGSDLDREPLLALQGGALRIGGILGSEFQPGERGWYLAARQELHAQELPDLYELLSSVAPYAVTTDPVGQLRHYEDDIADLLLVHGGTVVRQPQHPADAQPAPSLNA
ncbi:hypothetical protein AB0F13_01970 [Streptomyces sp. NPDC026206]|uniref:hypothetical protein n=1 Tax=Streptomyces sp. NPDC026206 TaxID=3157089 RepID=UPI003411BFE3